MATDDGGERAQDVGRIVERTWAVFVAGFVLGVGWGVPIIPGTSRQAELTFLGSIGVAVLMLGVAWYKQRAVELTQ